MGVATEEWNIVWIGVLPKFVEVEITVCCELELIEVAEILLDF